jgi:hypothetical protein
MRLSLLYLAVFLILAAACKTPPEAEVTDPLPAEAPAEGNVTETGGVTGGTPHSGTISREVYELTLAEVREFIEVLNRMIADKNYDEWSSTLSDEYYARISSAEYLARQSNSPLLASKKIVLRTPHDFFLHVVVPSRANSRVDEIEIFSDNRVSAFYVETSRAGRRLRVYELQKIENDWKIVE